MFLLFNVTFKFKRAYARDKHITTFKSALCKCVNQINRTNRKIYKCLAFSNQLHLKQCSLFVQINKTQFSDVLIGIFVTRNIGPTFKVTCVTEKQFSFPMEKTVIFIFFQDCVLQKIVQIDLHDVLSLFLKLLFCHKVFHFSLLLQRNTVISLLSICAFMSGYGTKFTFNFCLVLLFTILENLLSK